MLTILLIEDYADSARLVRRALEPYGYRLLHAEDGESGLRMAQEERPDLILLDMGLPDVEGQTLAGLLKRQAGLASVPLVALTAWPAATARDMARAYGCDDYISKPIDMHTFPQQVARHLEARRERVTDGG
jgi:two-component system cell cycle response regulator DivK